MLTFCFVKAALYTIAPRSPFFIFVLQNIAGYKNEVECLLQRNGAIWTIHSSYQRL